MVSTPTLPQDFVDLLTEFAVADVRYLVIGGYAVGFHDPPRATKDIDLVLAADSANVSKACSAFAAFGATAEIIEAVRNARLDEIVWFGVPPGRIDVLKAAAGLDFDAAFSRSERMRVDDLEIPVVGLDDLLAMKRAADRDQDRVDVLRLERVRARRK